MSPATASAAADYWRERARALGAHAVLSTDHAGTNPEAVTAAHRALLLPLLVAALDGSERTLLDLGCGRGRLTGSLAGAIGGRAIGVDPVAEQLAAAPREKATSYRLLEDGRLPLADGEADVAFTCLVLGALSAEELDATATELRRVVRPGGLVLLAESVSEQADLAHWAFRTPEDYAAALPWAGLQERARFDDAGDTVAVLAGRAA